MARNTLIVDRRAAQYAGLPPATKVESARNPTNRPTPMNPTPKTVALLAYPECSASVVFGMYDLFMSAGRDWDAYAGNPPGPQALQPRIVAAGAGELTALNGVRIVPEGGLSGGPAPDIVCVPDLTLMPGDKAMDCHAMDRMFRTLMGRNPTPEEREKAHRRIAELEARDKADGGL